VGDEPTRRVKEVFDRLKLEILSKCKDNLSQVERGFAPSSPTPGTLISQNSNLKSQKYKSKIKNDKLLELVSNNLSSWSGASDSERSDRISFASE